MNDGVKSVLRVLGCLPTTFGTGLVLLGTFYWLNEWRFGGAVLFMGLVWGLMFAGLGLVIMSTARVGADDHWRVKVLRQAGRYADLLFEVVTRRYEALKPVVLTTNKPFSEWPDVFPHAACVVTLVDRLIHRCEVLHIEGQSYRAKEAKERAAAKKALKPNETRPDLRPSE